MLHQTITVVAGYHLSELALGPVVEPVLVVALTLVDETAEAASENQDKSAGGCGEKLSGSALISG